MRALPVAVLFAPLLAAALLLPGASAQTRPSVVAAENFYGDIAAQIGGENVPVTSILSNPDQDPHLFSASPSTARAIAEAGIVVYNGVDYDPWMAKLLGAGTPGSRQVIVVGDLVKRKAGVNPHLWYDAAAVTAAAKAIAGALTAADRLHAAGYAKRLAAFEDSMKPVAEKVAALRARFAGQAVTATEPVFGYMASAIGLVMRNERFQLAIMNGTEPRPSDVAAFEADLRRRAVRVLLYNSQATGPAAQRLLQIARTAGVPVVGVTETEPGGTRFQDWMMGQLTALEAALDAPR